MSMRERIANIEFPLIRCVQCEWRPIRVGQLESIQQIYGINFHRSSLELVSQCFRLIELKGLISFAVIASKGLLEILNIKVT